MSLIRKTILTVALGDDDAGLALVELGARGVRVVRESGLAPGGGSFEDRLHAAAGAMVGTDRVDEIVLVVPAGWCAMREIALTPGDWGTARAGVMESLEDLIPIPAEGAHVGLLGLFDTREECVRGVIVAARRSAIDPVLVALRQVAAGARESVVSSHMAAVGLGFEGRASVWVREPDGVVEAGVGLAYGLPVSVEPSDGADGVSIGTDVSLAELAVGGVAARRSAPDSYVPLVGAGSRVWGAFAGPAAALVAAVLLLLAVPVIWNARLDAGTERAVEVRASRQASFAEAQEARREAERYDGLCGAYDGIAAGWRSVTPVLEDAVGSLGEGDFFYRLRFEAGALYFTGESSDPGAVLERLEASATLSEASQSTPLTPSPIDPDLLVFTFRATEARP